MKKLIIKNSNNTTISKYIMSKYPLLNYNFLKKAIRNKDIKLNSKRIDEDIILNDGDTLEVYITDNILFNIPKEIKYYYEDEKILIAYKWQGILSNHEEKLPIDEPTFEETVRKDLNLDELYICHRLDRNTSGLVIFAKSKDIFNSFKKIFNNFEVEKHYIAYVSNYKFNKDHEVLEGYITQDKKSGYSKIFDKEVKNSSKVITEYSVISVNKEKDYAILDVILHTGKMHQIRCHMAHINHYIIGDSKYGKNEINKKFKKTKQMLIAYKYKFNIKSNNKLSYLNKIEVKLTNEEVLNLL